MLIHVLHFTVAVTKQPVMTAAALQQRSNIKKAVNSSNCWTGGLIINIIRTHHRNGTGNISIAIPVAALITFMAIQSEPLLSHQKATKTYMI